MRWLWGLLLLLALATAVQSNERGPWQQNEAAIVLFGEDRFEEALELLLLADQSLPGNQVVRRNIAVACIGAAQQKIKAEDYSRAVEILQLGKEYDDQEERLWLLSGIALLRSGKFAEAEGELNEAWAMSGDEPHVLQFLGQLYYETDRMFEAVDIWQRALEVDPQNETLRTLLGKARRELAVEKELDRNYSGHFILSYAENRKADIGGEVLDALEDTYTWAGAKLGHYPERQVPVILYTQRQFSGLTGSPEWAAGLYDGKIRLSIGGLNRVDAPVKALLAHEFMHVMVRETGGSRVPTWLNEGLAEVAAREVHAPRLLHLERANSTGQLLALEELNGSFRTLDPTRVGLAYEQSYSFVQYLVDRFGWYPMAQLLARFKEGLDAPDALRRTFGDYDSDLRSLERDWRRQL